MNHWVSIAKIFTVCGTMSLCSFVLAAPELTGEAKEHIAKHEKISAAHAEAAKCLRAGNSEKACELPLQQACKGIAIGKYCGMKH